MRKFGPRERLLGAVLALVVLAAAALLVYKQMPASQQPVELSIGELLTKAEQRELRRATLEGDLVTAEAADGTTYTALKEPGFQLTETLHRNGVKVSVRGPQPNLWMLPFALLIPAMIIGILWFVSSRQGGAGHALPSFGKSRARRFSGEHCRVTFADVAGVEEAKSELSEVVTFLREPQRFKAIGARIPRGILLVGPPGTGKTLLSRALAGEAGVPFFSISGSEFVEMFVGVGASRVRDLFHRAKRHAPCIVFVDEIDAVGRQRGSNAAGTNDERDQTLNQLLVEMDGFDTNSGVVVIAATNRPDILDHALLRPGRFDRQVALDSPDLAGRRAILSVHARGMPMAAGADLHNLARRTVGFSGADLANVINEAAILAARTDRVEITDADLDEAVLRVVAGPQRKSRILSPEERTVTAYHEVGHALVTKLRCKAEHVHKVSIVSRGQALGVTVQAPLEDRYLMTRSQLMNRMAAMMGGRAAEEIIFDEVTTGAQQDIDRASSIARRMVCELGMGGLGNVTYGRRDDVGLLGQVSDSTAARIDEAVVSLVEEAYDLAKSTLLSHRDQLVRVAERLQEVETIDGAELDNLLIEEHVLTVDLDRLLN